MSSTHNTFIDGSSKGNTSIAIPKALQLPLQAFKRKYYLNKVVRGLLVSLAILLTAYLGTVSLEYYAWLGTSVRGLLFFSILGLLVYVTATQIAWPLLKLFNITGTISYADAAVLIGKHFPEISDKLLNTLQLAATNPAQGTLLAASIEQRTKSIAIIPFTNAVNITENRRYLKYALPPVLLGLVLLIFTPSLFTEGTTRLVNYNHKYTPPPPFTFGNVKGAGKAFRNEDVIIAVNVDGKAMPDAVYLVLGGRKYAMAPQPKTTGYTYTLTSVQNTEGFYFEAAGFTSSPYQLQVLARPTFTGFTATLNYPAYLGRTTETLTNTGNFTVPAGTIINWAFDTRDTKNLSLSFDAIDSAKGGAHTTTANASITGNGYTASRRLLASTNYSVNLSNQYGPNKEAIKYNIEVIPDQFPAVTAEAYKDSTLFNYLIMGGTVSDDYGISKLVLNYKITRSGATASDNSGYKQRVLKLPSRAANQSWVYQWALDSVGLKPADAIDYFLMVYDNDGVRGPKASRSSQMQMRVPDANQLAKDIESDQEDTQAAAQQALTKAQELKKEIEKAKDKLRGKRSLSFQDEKSLQELLNKKAELQKDIEKLQQENQKLNQQQKRFQKPNEELTKKMEELQKLMDEILDDETKKLYDQLQKLLDEKNKNPDQVEQQLEKLEKQQENLSKELDRSLELFKKLKFDQKLATTVDKLKDLAKNQEELANQNLDKKDTKTDKQDSKADPKADKNQEGKPDSKDGKQDAKADNKDGKQDPKPDNKDGKQDPKADKNQEGKPEDKPKPNSAEEKQKELSDAFKEAQDDIKKLEELNKDLEDKNQLPDQDKDQQNGIEKDQKDAQDKLSKNNKKGAAKNQKEAADKMEQLAKQLEQSGQDAEEEQHEENAKDLRNILENLLTLSFDQEDVMKDFRSVFPSDPRYVALGQRQVKLKDDAKIIEDSLNALAKRVFEIQNFVTRELTAMNSHLDESAKAIKQRRQDIAANKQQLAMTSMNNLALLLNDVLKQMQDQMQQQQQQKAGGKGKGKKKKQQGKPKPGDLSKMQQELNGKIQQLQQSGKQGKQLSEELGKLAQQQEALRRALQQMEGEGKDKKPGNSGKDGDKKGSGGNQQLKDMMEQTEQDLVNKRLTQQTIMRQKEIMTRLLEAENSMRERGEEEQRESKSGKDLPRQLPPNFEQYLKQKQQQVELLKTIPPGYTPFYKAETNRYLQSITK